MTTGSKGKKGGSVKKGQATTQVYNPIWDDVILLIVLAFSIVLFLSYFSKAGRFGAAVSDFMFGTFGMIAYVVPIVIFLSAAFFLSNRGKRVAWVKVISAAVFVILLCCFATLIFSDEMLGLEVKNFYSACQDDHLSGGFLGCIFTWVFKKCIGTVATWVLLIVLLIISIVLITEKSFFKGVKKGSQTIYHSAKDDAARRHERRLERNEQRRAYYEELNKAREAENISINDGKIPRSEMKVHGVMMNTSLKDASAHSDDMHEISGIEPLDEDTLTSPLKTEHKISLKEPTEFVDDYIDDVIPQRHIKESHVQEPENEVKTAATSANTRSGVENRNTSGKTDTRKTSEKTSEKTLEKNEKVNLSIASGRPCDDYEFPPFDLLEKGKEISGDSRAQLEATAEKLQDTLETFGVRVKLTDISQGPTVTRYELEPEPGVKVSKIVGLSDDIKLRMAATDIRIEAPIPGKAAVGIEIPNASNAIVKFRDLIETDEFINASSRISFAVGKDLAGKVVVADIGKMPHMLIAGATGSGKSVCINTLIMSILYKAHPDDVKLIMIDPKVVELSVYNGIPHLLIPVVTDPKKAAAALNWGVSEMTDRYNKFAEFGVRDLKGYNKKVESLLENNPSEEDKEKYKKMPQIIIIVDELADLMMVAPGDVEDSICRLAQLARAAGIHLIIATQRPSVDVITGLIKANMPSRVAFSVSSGVDSRTILDMNGAEKLLGKGDMLFYPQGYPKPSRIQGAYISDNEVSKVVDFLKEKSQNSQEYNSEVEEKIKTTLSSPSASVSSSESDGSSRDDLYREAGIFIIENDKASIGNLQRKFKIGFNRAARIMDQLSEDGVVGEAEGTKPRQVLMSIEEFEDFVEEYV